MSKLNKLINYICSIIEKMNNLFLGHIAFLNELNNGRKPCWLGISHQKDIFLDEYLVYYLTALDVLNSSTNQAHCKADTY